MRRLTPEFEPHAHAKDGKAVEKFEKGKGDLPVSVLMRYWKQRTPITRSLAQKANAILSKLAIYVLSERTVPRGDEIVHKLATNEIRPPTLAAVNC